MVFFNHATRQMTIKIVYYGPGLCGKTTNLNTIYARTAQKARGEMVSLNTETDRTLFFDLLPIEVGVVGGFKAKLQLYTVPGQVFYNSTRKLVLKGVDGIVFVADSQVPMLDANKESLQNLNDNLKELGLVLGDIPMVLQWNKRDLKNIVPVDVMSLELNPKGLDSFQSVAQDGTGVFETLRGITKLALTHIKTHHLGEPGAVKAALAPEKLPPPAPRVPAPEPLQASDVFMGDTHGGTDSASLPEPLSFLDLPSSGDLFMDDPGPGGMSTPVPLPEPVYVPALVHAPASVQGSAPASTRSKAASLATIPIKFPASLHGTAPLPSPASPEAPEPVPCASPLPTIEPLPAASSAVHVSAHPCEPSPVHASAHPSEPLPVHAFAHPSEPSPVHAFAHPSEPSPVHASAHASEPSPVHASAHASGPSPVHASAHASEPSPVHASAHPSEPSSAHSPRPSTSRLPESTPAAAPMLEPSDAPSVPVVASSVPAPGLHFRPALNPPREVAHAGSNNVAVRSPLMANLLPPKAKGASAMPGLLRPNLLLKPNVSPAAPRLQAPSLKPSLPGMRAAAPPPVMRLALPAGAGEGELEVVVTIRQNGATVAEHKATRPAVSSGAADRITLEISRS